MSAQPPALPQADGQSHPLIPGISQTYQVWAYYGVGALLKIVKYLTLVKMPISAAEGWESYRMWLLINFIYCWIPPALRLPALATSSKKGAAALQFLSFWASDAAVLLRSSYAQPLAPRISYFWLSVALLNPFTGTFRDHAKQEFSSGRISAVDTARLNPKYASFCLQPEDQSVLVPLTLQYPDLSGVKFAFTPLSHDQRPQRQEHQTLSARQLRDMKRRLANSTEITRNDGENVVFLEVSRPGTIWIERVIYFPNLDARIINPLEVTVPSCPRARFAVLAPPSGDLRCQGCETNNSPLIVDAYGTPPLMLRWSRIFHLDRIPATIENIVPNAPNGYHSGSSAEATAGHPQHHLSDRKQSQSIRLSLPLSCTDIGDHIYVLDAIIDSFGNEVRLHDDLVSTHQITNSDAIYPLTVLQRPAVVFEDCDEKALRYLRRDSESQAPLVLISNSTNLRGYNVVDIRMTYRPPKVLNNGPSPGDPFLWEQTFTAPGGEARIEVPTVLPGEYTVTKIHDKYCPGEFQREVSCSVMDLPPPYANITGWSEITECYGVKGVTVSISFSGTPPFTLHYTLKRKGRTEKDEIQIFDTHDAQFEIQPLHGGDYTFSFNRLSDAHHHNILISAPQIVQTVENPVSVEFVGGHFDAEVGGWVVRTCDDTVPVSVKLSGSTPWALSLRISSDGSSEFRTIQSIQQSHYSFEVEVPIGVRERSGSFDVAIVAIEDSRGCKVDVVSPGLFVEVRDNKPTVKVEGEGIVKGFESELVDLPIGFTGSPPWTIQYRREGTNLKGETFTVNSTVFRDKIPVKVPGLYRILSVEGENCPGSVVSGASTFQVDAIPKPSADLIYSEGVSYEALNNSYILQPSCQGTSSSVSLALKGRSPFHLSFQITEKPANDRKVVYNPVFYSPDDQYQLQLQTSNNGRVFYELVHLIDSVHLEANRAPALLSQKERLMFEQEIHALPTAQFKSNGSIDQYLHRPFVSTGWDSSVALAGVPPFQIQMSIRHLESDQLGLIAVTVPTTSWRISVPEYTFHTLGRHLVEIISVSDASGCPHQQSFLMSGTPLVVDVYPNPIMAPHNSHFCAGDIARFELQGLAPWTIDFLLNGRHYTEEVSTSMFSIPLDRPGQLSITSIKHSDTRRPMALDVSYQILSRPSAVVSYPNSLGHRDNLIGEQVSVNFILQGTPPFTFTYQRVNPSGEGDPSMGSNIRERYTVNDLEANHYTLGASYEGVWEVIDLVDKYCQRP